MREEVDLTPRRGGISPAIIYMKKIIEQDRKIISIPDYEGAGIYMIRNNVNGKVYIGSAKNIHSRIKKHDQSMRKEICNEKFLEDIEKGHTFTCEILEKCDNIMFVELIIREKYYSEKYNSFKDGYNTAPIQTYDLDFFIKMKNEYMISYLTRRV